MSRRIRKSWYEFLKFFEFLRFSEFNVPFISLKFTLQQFKFSFHFLHCSAEQLFLSDSVILTYEKTSLSLVSLTNKVYRYCYAPINLFYVTLKLTHHFGTFSEQVF